MLKSFIKALGFVVGLSMSGLVCAVGMGGINLTSALGEPLKLEVELETSSKAETNSLAARLASPERFKAAGIDYPYSLPPLKFQIATHADNDQPYLIITSFQPINEPFVTLLVELSWPSGTLLREYTFLLDPPGYAADQSKAIEVKPVEPAIAQEESTSAGAEEQSSEVTESAPLPVEENIPVAETPDTPPKTEEAAPVKSNIAAGTITVKRGDTLHQIARQIKSSDAESSDISLEQLLVALYRANRQAFVGNNMNRLRAGQILRMPEQPELDSLTQAQARKEIRVQVADWNVYRQKLAAASGAMKEGTGGQEASGKVTTTVTDPSPLSKEPAKEVVKLSRGESPGNKAPGSEKIKNTQDKINAQQEDAIAENKAVAENKARAALLEKNILAMQRLVELKNQNDAVQKNSSGKAGVLPRVSSASAVAATEGQAASTVNPGSGVAPALPAARSKAVTEPSLVDQVLGEPLYLAGIAALLLLLGGLALWFKRRGQYKNKDESSEDMGSTTGRIAAPIEPSPETGDFTKTMVDATGAGNVQMEDVDPISEADLFLNFGRDEQAEEILKDALSKNPDNHQIHLKLLSIYLNRRDVAAFSAIASQLQKSGDTKAWEQAAAMGLKLEPNNPMYGGDSRVARAPEETNTKAAPPEIMFDVGAAKKQPATMDFDLGLATTQVPAVGAEARQDSTLIMNAPMDFDVTGTRASASPENDKVSSTDLDDLIFDVTGNTAPVPEAPKAKAPDAPMPESDDLSFTLDIPGADKFDAAPPPAVSKPPLEINFTEISLNLNDTSAVSGAAGDQDAHWQDVATKLDLATAYQEMGDAAGAREILEEVLRDGDDQQRAAAKSLLQQLG